MRIILPADTRNANRAYQHRPANLDDGTADVCLHETASDSPSQPFIALSYCLGGVLPLRTTAESAENHKARIAWADLPVLCQDVVSLARLLACRYVWIDALCIIQGDVADWTREGMRMASYFPLAKLTLDAAAAAAPDAVHTLQPKAPGQPHIIMNGPMRGAVKVHVSKLPTHVNMESICFHRTQLLCTPLATRAWALQERLMAPRIVHFGPEEMVWECAAALRCECSTPADVYNGRRVRSVEPFRASHHRALTTRGGVRLVKYWEELLETYLTRSLTFEGDKLSAIMGLAKQMKTCQSGKEQLEFLGDYVLGIWSADSDPSSMQFWRL